MAAPTAARPSGTNSAARPIRPNRRKLPFPLNLYHTAIGKKWVMAVTGIMLLGFVLAHMAGNLKLYIGVVEHNGEMIYDADVYAEFLRELLVPLFPHGLFLWILRVGLIGAFGAHIHAAYSLTRINQQSNYSYQSKRDWLAANFASRSMRYTGVIVLAYLIFHLADLTWGWIPNTEWEYGEVQANVVNSFSNPGIAMIYIVANVLLSVHIYHGVYSMFQSLGVNNPQYNSLRRLLATGLAVLILVGNVSFPVAVLTGLIEYDPSLLGPVS
ncbi:MAG: succinate dehydrogenase cytochrome b subunit [Actinomycetota bacterium]